MKKESEKPFTKISESVICTDSNSEKNCSGHIQAEENRDVVNDLNGIGVGETYKAKVLNRKAEDEGFLDRVIFIDSTWNQTRSIFGDERLRGNGRLIIKIIMFLVKSFRHNPWFLLLCSKSL